MGMVKIMEMLPRAAGVSREYFHDHWRHPHGSWGLTIKNVRAYTQSHRFDTPHLPASQARFDGVAEIWLEGVNDCQQVHENPSLQRYILNDAPLFADTKNQITTFTDEEVLQSAPSQIEVDGSADFAWRLETRPVSVKLVQMFDRERAESFCGDDDLALGQRLGALRHVRLRPNAMLHPDGAAVGGFRELYWATYTDFDAGVSHDPGAFQALLAQVSGGYTGLFNAERFPI